MTTTVLPAPATAPAPMSVFERYLTVWVFLCIVVGIALGQMLPGPFQAIGRMEVAKVNLPVGLLIWVMIIPMLLKVDFASLSQVKQHWRGIGVTLFVNWAVKPFSMALLGWIFIRHVFAPYLPAGQADSYIAVRQQPYVYYLHGGWSDWLRDFLPCRGAVYNRRVGSRLQPDWRPAFLRKKQGWCVWEFGLPGSKRLGCQSVRVRPDFSGNQ